MVPHHFDPIYVYCNYDYMCFHLMIGMKGSLDAPLIVQGKRPRKPSLIMRMKFVEDDPDDEILLQVCCGIFLKILFLYC